MGDLPPAGVERPAKMLALLGRGSEALRLSGQEGEVSSRAEA